jgi:hypothetical protein
MIVLHGCAQARIERQLLHRAVHGSDLHTGGLRLAFGLGFALKWAKDESDNDKDHRESFTATRAPCGCFSIVNRTSYLRRLSAVFPNP